jgi:hypothetical protein
MNIWTKHCHQRYIHQVERFNPCIEQVQPADVLIFFSQKMNPQNIQKLHIYQSSRGSRPSRIEA